MTSSLPDFSASPAAASAADASSLATLLPGAAAGPAAEFATLIGGAPAPANGSAPVAPEAPPALVACATTSTRLLASSELVSAPGPIALVTLDPVGAIAAAPVVAVDATTGVAAIVEPAEPAAPREVTRDMLEEAATFVTSLLQSLLPEAQLPEFSAVAYQGAAVAVGSDGARWASGLARAEFAPAGGTPAQDTPAAAPAAPQLFTLAADGAIELKLDLAQFKPVDAQATLATAATLEISAELQRPGEIDLRLEASALVAGNAGPAASAAQLGREIFAGKNPARKIDGDILTDPAERNFVIAGEKRVKSASPVAGISVAKTDSTMPVAPIQEGRTPRKPEAVSALPVRADFQVAAPLAERISVPATTPAGQNFAERAVETVTNLVDTQFSASMQKAGSVRLHLRFGGEDLNVRVELKDGAVQTDFRTDSPELRSALAREWQAVAAQSPEQMRRYLEPIFAPNSSSASDSGDTPSFANRHQQQAQQDHSSRPGRDGWTESASFVRRTSLHDSFVPEPAAPRSPVLLPTSSRLSVLA